MDDITLLYHVTFRCDMDDIAQVTYLMEVIPVTYLMEVIPVTYLMEVIPETHRAH
jgi:hypothetical protein